MKVLELQSISKKFGKFRINNINLVVGKKYFVLLGPTGAGKSVLLEIIAGLLTPDRGKIRLNDVDITLTPPEKRKIGFVPQDYALFPHLSVFKNIEYGLRIKGVKDTDMVVKLSEKLGIKHLLDRKTTNLSGGEKQRVALARALIIQPELILLDEPFSAVDLRTKEMLMNELKRVHAEFDVPVIHVTHSFIEATMLADRVAVMMNGEIVEEGAVKDLFTKARSKEVADFVGVKNLFKNLLNLLE
ncbi:MAG TPA: ATP-binding cassette domain-containing protein [Archaeoglobaceae archaeon]|nr:ATP-binding cassette domain-containing protein [Archaeoglobaceae archaeon]